MYTIGELARAAGVPATTVRFYERKGLLAPDGRTESNYRTYGAAGLERLRFILAAKRTGFTLDDIAHLLDLADGTGDCCGDVKTVIEHRLEAVDTRLDELRHARDVLGRALAWCHESGGSGHCPLIEELTAEPG